MDSASGRHSHVSLAQQASTARMKLLGFRKCAVVAITALKALIIKSNVSPVRIAIQVQLVQLIVRHLTSAAEETI